MYYSLSLLQLEQFMQTDDVISLKSAVLQILFYPFYPLILLPECMLSIPVNKRK